MKNSCFSLDLYSDHRPSACESNASNPQTTGMRMQTIWEVPLHGNYIGWSDHEPQRKWLELNADGTVTTFLTEEADEAEWKLKGKTLR